MPTFDMNLENGLVFMALGALCLMWWAFIGLVWCGCVWLKKKRKESAVKKAGWNKLEWWLSTDDEEDLIDQLKEEI